MEESQEVAGVATGPAKKQELPSMTEEDRTRLLESLQHFSQSFPEAILSGGTGLMIQYQAKTGDKMFGAFKDIDAYETSENLKRTLESPPEQYRVKKEESEQPSERHLSLEDTKTHDHLDLFVKNPYYEPEVEEVIIGGVRVKVLTVEELLVERLIDMRRQLDKKKPIKPKYFGYLKILQELGVDPNKMSEIWNAKREARVKEAGEQIAPFTTTLQELAEKGEAQDFQTLVGEAAQAITRGEGMTTKSSQKFIERVKKLRPTAPPVGSEEFSELVKEIKSQAASISGEEYAGGWQRAVEQFPVPEDPGFYFKEASVKTPTP